MSRLRVHGRKTDLPCRAFRKVSLKLGRQKLILPPICPFLLPRGPPLAWRPQPGTSTRPWWQCQTPLGSAHSRSQLGPPWLWHVQHPLSGVPDPHLALAISCSPCTSQPKCHGPGHLCGPASAPGGGCTWGLEHKPSQWVGFRHRLCTTLVTRPRHLVGRGPPVRAGVATPEPWGPQEGS